MQPYYPLIGVLVALLAGLAVGKAWERYKLREGRWIDRRKVRQAPHFILGLNYLVAQQVDSAIEELERASEIDPGALEVKLVLSKASSTRPPSASSPLSNSIAWSFPRTFILGTSASRRTTHKPPSPYGRR